MVSSECSGHWKAGKFILEAGGKYRWAKEMHAEMMLLGKLSSLAKHMLGKWRRKWKLN